MGPEPAAFCPTEWQALGSLLQLMLDVVRHELTFATEYSHDVTRKEL